MLWDSLKSLLHYEYKQRQEEGCDVSGLAEQLAACTERKEMEALYDKLDALSVSPSFPYHEPDSWEDICATSEVGTPDAPVCFEKEELYDRIYGAWLGRSAGCALGKPFETYPYIGGKDGKPGFYWIKRWLEGAGEQQLSDYVPGESKAKEDGLWVNCPDSHREKIRFMETDDDIRYMVLGLLLGEEKGNSFTPDDIAVLWQRYLPVRMTFTAEACAYINSLNVWEEDPQKRQDYCRFYHNPFREWIGAQIRIDHYAYVNAGLPHEAARTAFQDATFSHAKNGVYGAMLFAAAIAEAFKGSDVETCLNVGLASIPRSSRLYEAVTQAIAMAKTAPDAESLYRSLWDAFGSYHSVHTINNAACCAAALIYGNGDFEKTISTAVACGWDTDCNGATVGSLLGALLGAKGLPEKWISPLHDTLYSAIPDFHPIAISACASRTQKLYEKLHG